MLSLQADEGKECESVDTMAFWMVRWNVMKNLLKKQTKKNVVPLSFMVAF